MYYELPVRLILFGTHVSVYWEVHNPNWGTHIFCRGVGLPLYHHPPVPRRYERNLPLRLLPSKPRQPRREPRRLRLQLELVTLLQWLLCGMVDSIVMKPIFTGFWDVLSHQRCGCLLISMDLEWFRYVQDLADDVRCSDEKNMDIFHNFLIWWFTHENCDFPWLCEIAKGYMGLLLGCNHQWMQFFGKLWCPYGH